MKSEEDRTRGNRRSNSGVSVGKSEPLKVLELGRDNMLGRSICTNLLKSGIAKMQGGEESRLVLGCQRVREVKAGQMDAGVCTCGLVKRLA